MKRFLCLLLCAAFISSLAACGVSQKDYDALSNEKNDIKSAYDLKVEHYDKILLEKNNLQKDYDKKEKDYDKILLEKNDLQKEYDDFYKSASQFLKLSENEQAAELEKSKKQNEITELENKIKSLNTDIGELNSEITKLQNEKTALQTEIKKITSEYTFSAGNYYVGEDIPQGRYDIVWVSGSGNCFVRDEKGRSSVNEIFGNRDEDYLKEYRNAELVKDGKIEIHSGLTVKFVAK